MNLRTFFLFLVLSSGFFKSSLHSNPNIGVELHGKPEIIPYLIPHDHPAKDSLDYIFSQSRVTENESSLVDAGFEIIAKMPVSFVVVARHYAMPGYIFKIYLDSEVRTREGTPHWKLLSSRCKGARRIRKVIKKKGFVILACLISGSIPFHNIRSQKNSMLSRSS